MTSEQSALIRRAFVWLRSGDRSGFRAKAAEFRNLRQALEAQAERGCLASQVALGWMYESGIAVKKDVRRALAWYGRAAKDGEARAEYRIGQAYMRGEGRRKSIARGLRWYIRAAAKGYPHALYAVGCAYTRGRGVRKDRALGLRLLKEAYRKGASEDALAFGETTALAALEIALAYVFGEPENFRAAVKWYRSAARRVVVGAMHNLGASYACGDWVRKSRRNALRWYKKAAALGDPLAMKRIAELSPKHRTGRTGGSEA